MTTRPVPDCCPSWLLSRKLIAKLPQVIIRDQYRVTLLGNTGIGKTALIDRFIYEAFPVDYYQPEFGECSSKICLVDDEHCVIETIDAFNISEWIDSKWAWLRNTDAAMLTYDITDSTSFYDIPAILKELLEAKEKNVDVIPILLVGCKMDLDSEGKREVTVEDAEELARCLGCGFIETSAKIGTRVDEAFFNLVRVVKKQRAVSLISSFGPLYWLS